MNTRMIRGIPRFGALAACTLSALLVVRVADAGDLGKTQRITLPAAPLSESLRLLAKQADLEISFPPEDVSGLQAAPVNGTMTPRQALALLIRGSTLAVVEQGSSSVAIRHADESSPAPKSDGKTTPARRAPNKSMNNTADPADNQLEEIIVTSTQRPERLIDAPLAISAVSEAALTDNHVKDFSDIALLVPNFVSGSNYGYLRNSSMRGISSNQYGFADESSIAMYVDGVYQGRATAGSGVNAIYDIERVEVVRGPQASLFGHSAIAGAINMIRNQPTDLFSQSYDVGFGERNRVLLRGVINLPVTNTLAIRIAADSERQDGYITNLNGGKLEPLDIQAGRIISRYTGIENLDASLSADYEQRRQNGSTHAEVGLPDFTADITTVGRQNYANFYIFDAGLDLTYHISPSLALISDSTFRKVANAYIEKYDGLPTVAAGPYSQSSTDRLAQQEFKLIYQEAKTAAIAGVSAFDEHLSGFIGNWVDHTFAFTGKPAPDLLPNDYSQAFFEDGYFNGHFSGWSAFLDGTIPMPGLDRLTATATVRYTYDRKDYTMDLPDPSKLPENAGKPFAGAYYNWGFYTSPPIELAHSWSNVSFRGALNFALDDHNILYAQYSQGWKAGGIDTFRVANADSTYVPFFGMNATAHGGRPNAYGPESSDNYEIGVKGNILDRRFSYAVDAYYFTYRDLQVPVYQSGGAVIKNIGAAEGRGLETDLKYSPSEHWALFANGAYNFTKILRYEANLTQVGLPLVQSPKYTSAAGVTYTTAAFAIGGRAFIGGTLSQRSAFRTDTAITDTVDGYVLFNVRIGYTSSTGRYTTKLFADNVTDKFTYSRFEQVTPFVYPVAAKSVIGPPRTIGIDFHASF
jgi:iron complex outermembrane receptor protein